MAALLLNILCIKQSSMRIYVEEFQGFKRAWMLPVCSFKFLLASWFYKVASGLPGLNAESRAAKLKHCCKVNTLLELMN